MTTLTHARVELALHELRAGAATGDARSAAPSGSGGRPLLHLHGLGLRSPDAVPLELETWPGPIHALDFTGHGDSTAPKGGGYTPEVLIGDVDAALEQLGEATLIGRGLGGYVALMTAAARSDLVRGAIICDGPGLAGGGPAPGTPQIARIDPNAPSPPDPFALAELSKDVRPPDYAVDFVHIILAHTRLSQPIAVCARSRPEWLSAVLDELGSSPLSVPEALKLFAK